MTILVTCTACGADSRVQPPHMIVRFAGRPDERAAELLFACGACGGTPVQRVPEELAAVVVFRGAASLTGLDLPPAEAEAAQSPLHAPALSLDDLLELHLQLQDSDRVRCFLDEQADEDG